MEMMLLLLLVKENLPSLRLPRPAPASRPLLIRVLLKKPRSAPASRPLLIRVLLKKPTTSSTIASPLATTKTPKSVKSTDTAAAAESGTDGSVATRTVDNGAAPTATPPATTKTPKSVKSTDTAAAAESVATRTVDNGAAPTATPPATTKTPKSVKSTDTAAAAESVATRTVDNGAAPTATPPATTKTPKSVKSTDTAATAESIATRTVDNEDTPKASKSTKVTSTANTAGTNTSTTTIVTNKGANDEQGDDTRAPAADDGDAPSTGTIIAAVEEVNEEQSASEGGILSSVNAAISNTYEAMTSNGASFSGVPIIAMVACVLLVGLLLVVVGKKRRDRRRLDDVQREEIGLQNLPEPSGSDDIESGNKPQAASWDTFAGKEPIVVDAEDRDAAPANSFGEMVNCWTCSWWGA